MAELKIYSVSDRYINFLEKKYSNIYSNKVTNRTHTRKYLGVVLEINDFLYYVPLSSPKESDYQVAGDKKVIKKSIVPIMRMVTKNSEGEPELKGTLRISHMIPVPKSEIELYDLDNETDEAYKNLVKNEIEYIHRNENKIRKNAEVMYKQKAEAADIGYVRSALPFQSIEKMCTEFMNAYKE